MSEIILHHYPMSPYSEKVRRVLGFKRLRWKSVVTPFVMPKPDLLPLTGGYRRAPVLQLGNDVYCDSTLILRVLDHLQPQPPLLPAEVRASCAAFASLEPTLFFAAVATVFQPAGLKVLMDTLGTDALERFSKDRAALFAGGSQKRPGPEFARMHFLPILYALDQQLSVSPYLLGDSPTAADFEMYHPIWFVQNNAGVAPLLEPFYHVLEWAQRLRGLGEGESEEIASAEALGVARTSTTREDFDGPLLEPEGVKLGMRVRVNATDYGTEPVIGTLLHASVFELAIQREDSRAGEVVVHFPRAGYAIAPAAA